MPYIITRITDSKEDNQKFIDRFGEERFEKFQRLKSNFEPSKRDLYYWLDKTREDLEREFNQVILKGNEAVGENEEWLVVKVETKEQLRQLANDMPWCIKTGEEFDVAKERGVKWYLFLNKNDRRNKIMVADLNGDCEITDKDNHRIQSIPNAPEGFNFESNVSDNSFIPILMYIINRDDNQTLVNKFGDFFEVLNANDPNLKNILREKINTADLRELANYIDSNIRKFI